MVLILLSALMTERLPQIVAYGNYHVAQCTVNIIAEMERPQDFPEAVQMLHIADTMPSSSWDSWTMHDPVTDRLTNT